MRHYPKWEPDVEIQIVDKVEQAEAEDKQAEEDYRVYSDGSLVNGGVGGAAVLMRGNEVVKSRRLHLGSDGEHTVYEAELVGMILAVKMLHKEGAGQGGSMSMGVDNQAAIRATKAFHSQPGHYLVDLLHDDLRKLIPGNDERKLTIRWTPGHRGIIGNKAADIEAKKAANGDSSEGRELPKAFLNRDGTLKTLPKSKAALKQNLLGEIKDEAKTIMRNSPRYQMIHSIDHTAPSNKFAKKIQSLPRKHSSLIFQLCSGPIALNKHLHRIKKEPLAKCRKCNAHEETVHHLLLVCPAYTHQRNTLRDKIGPRKCNLKYLLNNEDGMKEMLRFVAATKRMEQTFGDITPPEEEEEVEER